MLVVGCAADPATSTSHPVPPPNRAPPPGSSRVVVFEGKTPCGNCNRVKIRLTLHRDEVTGAPTEHILERIGVGLSDERHVTRGPWTLATGSAVDPGASIVNLAGDTPAEYAHYQRVGETLLLLLDDNLQPRVGNAEHSFTLSLTE